MIAVVCLDPCLLSRVGLPALSRAVHRASALLLLRRAGGALCRRGPCRFFFPAQKGLTDLASFALQQSDEECVLDLELITDLVLQIDSHGEPGRAGELMFLGARQQEPLVLDDCIVWGGEGGGDLEGPG